MDSLDKQVNPSQPSMEISPRHRPTIFKVYVEAANGDRKLVCDHATVCRNWALRSHESESESAMLFNCDCQTNGNSRHHSQLEDYRSMSIYSLNWVN